MKLIIHIDGGSRGNPGPAAAGVVITTADGRLVHEGGYFLGAATNNVAEYSALLIALELAEKLRPAEVQVCADSELLVKQITGEYRVKNARLEELHGQAQRLLLKLPRWHFRHVRREFNARADKLANMALDRGDDVIVFGGPGGGDGAGTGVSGAPASDKPTKKAIRKKKLNLEVAPPPGDGTAASDARRISIQCGQPPQEDVCPAHTSTSGPFTADAVVPAGLCLHAAHAILPTLLAMKNMDPREFGSVPTLTVRCSKPQCAATFRLAPVVSGNGARGRKYDAK